VLVPDVVGLLFELVSKVVILFRYAWLPFRAYFEGVVVSVVSHTSSWLVRTWLLTQPIHWPPSATADDRVLILIITYKVKDKAVQ
jgi:hypothetical protein